MIAERASERADERAGKRASGQAGERERTRVVVVDDHQMVRAGIALSLLAADDIDLVGEAADGEEALRVCEEVRPDVVIMDLKLPRIDGISAIRMLHQRDPNVQVLALTSYPDDDLVPRALQAGALGYLLKNVELDQLIAAIRAARHGEPTFSQEATQALVRAVTSGPLGDQASRDGRLSEREREVLGLVVDGLSNQQIADRLVITAATVKYHVRSIFRKLGVSSRTELVALAIHRHLLR